LRERCHAEAATWVKNRQGSAGMSPTRRRSRKERRFTGCGPETQPMPTFPKEKTRLADGICTRSVTLTT
jgi:hypothetical protein